MTSPALHLQGEQSTWAKMSAIECNCGIEVTLDRCLRKLEARARHARSNEIQLRRMAGMPRSAAAEEAAAASGQPSQEAQEGGWGALHSRHGSCRA